MLVVPGEIRHNNDKNTALYDEDKRSEVCSNP